MRSVKSRNVRGRAPLSAYAAAAQNLRVQEGLRERFHDGLLRSRYRHRSLFIGLGDELGRYL